MVGWLLAHAYVLCVDRGAALGCFGRLRAGGRAGGRACLLAWSVRTPFASLTNNSPIHQLQTTPNATAGPIPWLIVAEMFDQKYVATAMSVSCQVRKIHIIYIFDLYIYLYIICESYNIIICVYVIWSFMYVCM